MRIADAQASYRNTMESGRFERVTPGEETMHPPVESRGLNPMLRCPLPFVNSSTDSLNQFYRNSIPQYRILPPSQ